MLPSGFTISIPCAVIVPVPLATSSKFAFEFKVRILLPSISISSTTSVSASITLASKFVLEPSSEIITSPPDPLSCSCSVPRYIVCPLT